MGISNDIRPNHRQHHQTPKKESEKPREDDDVPAKRRIKASEPEKEKEPETINLTTESKEDDRESKENEAFFGRAREENPAQQPPQADLPRWISYLILWLIAAVLLVVLIIINWSTINSLWQTKSTSGSTASSTVTPPTSSTSSTSSTTSGTADIETGSVVSTGVALTTGSTATGATTVKSTLKINLLNGSGVSGAAATAKATLLAAGYTIAHTGNARTFSYTSSMIYYHTGKDAQAALVKVALPALSTTLQLNDTVTGTTYDLVVVVGKK